MNNKKSQIRKELKELSEKSISIQKFLSHYCGIAGESIEKIKMSHFDVKILLPDLKKVSYEYLLNNKNQLYNGEIILVMDSYNHLAPYIAPTLYKEESFINVETDKDKHIKETIISENLNRYELSLLCRKYKKLGRMKEYRIAHDLLKSKKDCKVKQYKKQKELLKMEEIEI